MKLNDVYKIINKCLKKEKEFEAFYNCEFKSFVEEENDMIFMISKDSNLSMRFKNKLGDGSLQLSYYTNNSGTFSIRADFEFGKWFSKIKENIDFALNYLGYEFISRIDDHENDYGYNNGFEISRNNVDNNLEREIDELFVIFAFVLDV